MTQKVYLGAICGASTGGNVNILGGHENERKPEAWQIFPTCNKHQ